MRISLLAALKVQNSSSIDVAMTESAAGLANGTQYLALFNGASNAGAFQIHEINVDGTFPSGTFTISRPIAAARSRGLHLGNDDSGFC